MTPISTLRTFADDLDRVIQKINCPHTSTVIKEDNYRGINFVEITLNLPTNIRHCRVEIDSIDPRLCIKEGGVLTSVLYRALYVVEDYLTYCRDAFDLPFDRIPLHLNDTRYESNILEARLKGLV